jgi:hypothetical protein
MGRLKSTRVEYCETNMGCHEVEDIAIFDYALTTFFQHETTSLTYLMEWSVKAFRLGGPDAVYLEVYNMFVMR